ncbi:MAG: LysM peptidoglycan-binding domain-containing protein [Chloroflexi bacterium]|nr:LysM peptidoglycan-binding domain-containing protein [Chloroflexota bacterium]
MGPFKFAGLIVGLVVVAVACGDGGEELATGSPTAVPLGASATPSDVPSVGEQCSAQTYVVQSGDTLFDLALEFDVTVDAIAAASGLASPDVLDIDQELTIPCPVADGALLEDDTPSPTPIA